jgi:hypothetical protein
MRPHAPVLIDLEESPSLSSSGCMYFKLFFGRGGGAKFILERKLLSLAPSGNRSAPAVLKEMNKWVTCYEGDSDGLAKVRRERDKRDKQQAARSISFASSLFSYFFPLFIN